LIDNHKRYIEKAGRDISVLEEVVNVDWKKEPELGKLKSSFRHWIEKSKVHYITLD